MSTKLNLSRSIAIATILGSGAPAMAQDFEGTPIEEIVVTGSFIKGTPEDAALPVDQITSDELDKQGAPPPLEMLKSLSYMNGIVGESNQFTAGRGQAAEGSASINLRGFGAARTLVLLNGKRLSSEDANLIPSNAVARVEVLKDGGAVTYGSDAIGGVVNYITKNRVEGFELSGDYRSISDSDGDYNLGLSWGMVTENSDFFVSANYYHRSELLISDRDFALQPYSVNPEGGWSTGANPGTYTAFVDPGCEAFGGVLTNSATGLQSGTLNQCRARYTEWDNLVEEQNTYQLFSQYNLDLNDSTSLHIEALYASTDVPETNTSPSFTTTRQISNVVKPFPTSASVFYVPLTNPGLIALSAGDAAIAAATTASSGAYMILNQWRPFFAGGNPLFGYEASNASRERDNLRLSAELEGTMGDLGWTTSLTYGRSTSERKEYGISTNKLQLALRGLGGEGCNPGLGTPAYTPGTPGVGNCEWFNPFSNALPTAPTVGYVNPNFDSSLENSASLAAWLMDDQGSESTDQSAEFNFVLDGQLPFDLPGGQIGWAAGVQYRWDAEEQEYPANSNSLLNPCQLTPINGDTSCLPVTTSPYNFQGTYEPYDLSRDVYALFTEFFIPVTDNFSAQVAARFEDYGDEGGSSFDPKLSLRWQALDWLAFRASAGTTFRVAAQTSLLEREATGFAQVLGSNRPVSSAGNPDLDPEKAQNYNVGVLFSGDNFNASMDYWYFVIDDVHTTEPLSGILDIVFPAGVGPCAAVDAGFIADHFEFSGACDAANITKVKTYSINGASFVNDGIDITADYTWDEVGPGSLALGTSATWINKYETDDLIINGTTFEEGFDGAGYLNVGTTLYALPKVRGQVFLNYAMDTHNVRWTVNYIDSYEDQREQIFVNSPEGQTIDSIITHNLTYRTDLGEALTLTASIDNLTDEDPPFARTELNYDALTHTPVGRTFKLGAKYRF